MKYTRLYTILLVVGCFFIPAAASAATGLVKTADNSAVYYVDEDNVRHAFPNLVTYQSWYGGDFSTITTITPEELASMRLGQNIVTRPGKFLLKVPSSPEVYAVEPGGVLRHVMTAEVAKGIFGSNWESKLRDLPEVFFTNYTVGEPIYFTHQVPDGVVYQIQGSSDIYWKNNGILQKFDSEFDMLINGYNKSDVILTELNNLYKRSIPVRGQSDQIFNPMLKSNASTASCRVDHFDAALIFVTRDDDISAEEVALMKYVQEQLPVAFKRASRNLSSIDVDVELTVYREDSNELTILNDKGVEVLNLEELGQVFYESRDDKYDFLIVFNDYLGSAYGNEIASYTTVHNDFLGNNRITLDRARFNGSRGRLKGIVHMNNIDQYGIADSSQQNRLLNLINHELLHHWGASISFIDDSDQRSFALLSDDHDHWSKYLTSVSPLGGWGWVPQDNVYVATRSITNEYNFTDLDLYLMGLLPAQVIPPVEYLIPADPSDEDATIAATPAYVTIDQIINAHGNIQCVL